MAEVIFDVHVRMGSPQGDPRVSKTISGSTAQLVQLCAGYFFSYVLTGVLVKWFTDLRQPAMSDWAYLFNNTLGGSATALLVVLVLRWVRRLNSVGTARWGPFRFPAEVAYIIPSGVCTAIVIPTTTLMYSLPISVMVAMVIMRGSVIVISRTVDEIQIRQGILNKRVYVEENWAVVFALMAVATSVMLLPFAAFLTGKGVALPAWLGLNPSAARGSFDFLRSVPAMTILGLYIAAYMLRIYIMNYYKNTRGKGVPLDNRGFFAVEQIAATATMVVLAALFAASPSWFGWTHPGAIEFSAAVAAPDWSAIAAGIPYGAVAFFSVFIFMFEGRTATFAGLVNRLTSLLAGTAATIILWAMFGTRFPSTPDWIAVGFILISVGFLTRAERRRMAELGLAPAPAAPAVVGMEQAVPSRGRG